MVIKSNLDSFYVSDNLELTCNVVGGGAVVGDFEIVWTKDGSSGAIDEPNVDVVGNLLVIRDMRRANNGVYRCQMVRAADGTVVSEQTFSLAVEGRKKLLA